MNNVLPLAMIVALIAWLALTIVDGIERSAYLDKDIWTRAKHGPIPGLVHRTEYGVSRMDEAGDLVVVLDSGEVLVFSFVEREWSRLR